MNDDKVSEVLITDEVQPERRERTPEDVARDEFALLTLLQARLERGSDFDLIFPLPAKVALQA